MKQKYINFQREKTNIRCKLYMQNDSHIESIVIYGHGFAGHKDNKSAERLADKLISKNKGFALLTFDLPCHGEDVKKKLYLSDCIYYLDVVINDCKEVLGAKTLYANAISFGCFIILKYISDNGNPFEKIVLRSPAINMFNVVNTTMVTEDMHDKLAKGKEVQIGFDRKISITQQFLDDLKSVNLFENDYIDYADNILLMHGTKDEITPFEDTRIFSENNVIEFIPVENADHRYTDLKKTEFVNAKAIEFYGL